MTSQLMKLMSLMELLLGGDCCEVPLAELKVALQVLSLSLDLRVTSVILACLRFIFSLLYRPNSSEQLKLPPLFLARLPSHPVVLLEHSSPEVLCGHWVGQLGRQRLGLA